MESESLELKDNPHVDADQSSSELTMSGEDEETSKRESLSGSHKGAAPSLIPCSKNFCDYFVVCGLRYEAPLEPFLGARGGGDHGEGFESKLFRKKDKGLKPAPGVPYKGQQIHRYPQEDDKDRPVPSHLWLFTFPNGIILEESPLPPRFFVNALTYSDGTRSYVISIKFYEKTPFAVKPERGSKFTHKKEASASGTLRRLKADNTPKPERRVLYAPKAICYVSQLPLFAFFKSYLAEIFMICQPSSHSWNIPLERFISQIVGPIPVFFPPEIFSITHKINYFVGKTSISCKLPNIVSDFCITDVSFRYLFQALSVENVITLLVALLTEQKILFCSEHYVLLITVQQSLIDLLLPFQWPHTYIPIVPSNLLEFVDSPTPYVMGIHNSQLENLESELEEVIVVNCDQNTLKLHPYFVPLPQDLMEWVKERLEVILENCGVSQNKDFVEAEMQKIDLVFATRSAEYDGSSSDAEFTLKLRVCTMMLYERLFGGYDKFVTKQGDGRAMTLFDEAKFLETRDEAHQPFIQECTCRTVFDMFLSSREAKLFHMLSDFLVKFYYEKDVYKKMESLRKAATVKETKINAPESTGTTIWSYNHFPDLDHSRYPSSNASEKAPVQSIATKDIISEIAKRVRLLIKDGASSEFIVIAETVHHFLKRLHEGEVDGVLGSRIEGWFLGMAVETDAEVIPANNRKANSTKGSILAKTMKDSVQKAAKKFQNRASYHLSPHPGRRNTGSPAAVEKSPHHREASSPSTSPRPRFSGSEISPRTTPVASMNLQDPSDSDSIDVSKFQGGFEKDSMTLFLAVMRFYCDLGEVKYDRAPFRELCRLLQVIIERAEAFLNARKPRSLSHVDTNSSAEDDTTVMTGSNIVAAGRNSAGGDSNNVVICWSCGEVNRSMYSVCSSCNEAPLGSLPAEDSSKEKSKDNEKEKAHEYVVVNEELYLPKEDEKPFFDILKSCLVVGSAAFHTSSEGFALHKLSFCNVWTKYELWEYFIFSDYVEKKKLKKIEGSCKDIEPYPDLFPIAAFYTNAMSSIRLHPDLASKFIKRMPLHDDIKETLEQLSLRMYDIAQRLEAPPSAAGSNVSTKEFLSQAPRRKSGMRVIKDQSVKRLVASQVYEVVNKQNSGITNGDKPAAVAPVATPSPSTTPVSPSRNKIVVGQGPPPPRPSYPPPLPRKPADRVPLTASGEKVMRKTSDAPPKKDDSLITKARSASDAEASSRRFVSKERLTESRNVSTSNLPVRRISVSEYDEEDL